MGKQDDAMSTSAHAFVPTSAPIGWQRCSAAVVLEAVRLLGWPGVALPAVSLLDCRVHPVVVLDLPAHHARQATGQGPELDDDTLTIWEWPEYAGRAPRPALHLSGMVIRARAGWAQGVRDAMRWRGFGPAAVLDTAVLDTAVLDTAVLDVAGDDQSPTVRATAAGDARPDLLDGPVGEVARLEAAMDGIGLVTVGALPGPTAPSGGDPARDEAAGAPGVGRVLLAPEPGRRAPARRRVADRWLEEVLYRQALELDLYAVTAPRR